MTPQQAIDRATADGFFLALTMATAKGFDVRADEMMQFLREVANGTTLARGSEAEEFALYEKNLGRPATEGEKFDFYRQGRESRRLVAQGDIEIARNVLRDQDLIQ